MTNNLKLLIWASGVMAAALGANPAYAAPTLAGQTVSNSASVAYTVGGVAQTPVSTVSPTTFTVDRKIDILVEENAPIATTTVNPGQTGAFTTFKITNNTNDIIDIKLTAAQLTGGAAPHGGTDAFDVTGVTLYVDTNGNQTYDAGTDTAVTYLDEVAANGGIKYVFAVANVPLSATNGQVAALSLTGQAEAGSNGTTGSEGAVLANTTGANTAGVDNVFADAAGTDDVAKDGKSSARDDYTVSAPLITVTKQNRIISDPINNTTNPKYIPGAVVEYCIVVANTGGTAANSVNITDTLPTQVTGDTTYGLFQSGTYTGATSTCNLDGTAGGTITATSVSGTLGTLNAGATRTIYFRVTIN